MRHRKKKQKLTKNKHQRKALLRSLVSALILKERIIITEARAKKLRPFLEKTISWAKEDNLTNRRFLLREFSPSIVNRLIKEIGPRYKGRAGGYSRIIKIDSRKNDAAEMAIIELIK